MALLQPDTARIGHPPGKPAEDRVGQELASGTPQDLRRALSALIGADQVLHRAIDLVRYASDASPYRLIPQVVVTPRTIDDIVALLNYCRENGHHATFRAAGTSLCGQSQSDDILIDVRRHWYGMSIEDRGLALRARPGVILGHARTFLRRHGRRLGPDPASIDACTIGGVIANNAGGMRCRIERDSYHTVRSMTFVLASGTVIDTAQLDAEAAFMRAEPNLAQGLLKLRAELIADRALADRVRHKFAIRNTTGYRLDALLDADTPLEIFRHLVVGSEGTLAFMGEVVINTLPAPGATSVTWIPLPSIDEAVALVPSLVSLGAEAVELMVAPALAAAAQAFPGTPEYWRTLDPKAAALLVEFAATDNAALDQVEAAARALVAGSNLLHPLDFTRDAEAIEIDWRIREGLLGIVGKLRPEGTAVLNEDVCFPPARIAEGAHDLQALLIKHGFLPGVAGHAAFGNLHFTLTPKLDDPADLKRYGAFMDDLVELVIDKYDGSLKAEHGTGRNMAPFVRREWGDKATEMMWRIKKLADPHGILAPDSVLSRDDGIHLRRLKSTPTIENISDATHCIECGFCEPACPSRNVTMTPRQRIVIRREMARQPSGSRMFAQLLKEFEYDGIQTCAADGTCAVACPVSINTGALMKSFRQRENTDAREKVALAIAKRWRRVEALARMGMGAVDLISRVVGVSALTGLTAVARMALSQDLVPSVPGPMPQKAPRKLPETSRQGAAAVYFPACINRIFGRAPGMARRPSLPEALVALSARAGQPIWIPDNVRGLCCATPWSSKGYRLGHEWMATAIADAMWDWSNAGTLPVVIDAVSCTHGLLDDVRTHIDVQRQERFNKIQIFDAIAWAHQLLPSLHIKRKLSSAAVHPTCSTIHLGLEKKLIEIVSAVAHEVIVPIGTTCCGTAGDRGLLHPELVVSATREEKAYLDTHPTEVYLSANRTCEMGLQQATGKPYESFIFALEMITRTEDGTQPQTHERPSRSLADSDSGENYG
ncbi:MAG TPA: FAD-binding and (Fe-S)-binding domain-containing protein [Candidatus Acidoferrum sp.]|nr:FAD-binding and (Fe-S)-binding domain-containing protein [Candidatus Acidoferrum sp.]